MNMARSSPVQNSRFLTTGDSRVDAGREPVQMGWYEFAATFCKDKQVLDVGCGMAQGLAVLKRCAAMAYGIDRDPRLQSSDVRIMAIEDVPSDSVDVAVCIDVIEHVEEDLEFARQLCRVAREQVLLSTPNWVVDRCIGRYHVREYMPHELVGIFEKFGRVDIYKGTGDGAVRCRVRHRKAYEALNRLRASPLTGFPARLFNHMLPVSARIHSAQFIRVLLQRGR
jgi:2-polyprenyl-3-methyl-5-hydroxy-6-metoxy-1,4-benzoquinol methylase